MNLEDIDFSKWKDDDFAESSASVTVYPDLQSALTRASSSSTLKIFSKVFLVLTFSGGGVVYILQVFRKGGMILVHFQGFGEEY